MLENKYELEGKKSKNKRGNKHKGPIKEKI